MFLKIYLNHHLYLCNNSAYSNLDRHVFLSYRLIQFYLLGQIQTSKTFLYILHFSCLFFFYNFLQPVIIGVIALSGDKIIRCDIFATHDLFKNSYLGLLGNYYKWQQTYTHKSTSFKIL